MIARDVALVFRVPKPLFAKNSPPEVTSVSLSPSGQATTNELIEAVVTTTDSDGDAVAVGYEWFVNDVAVGQSTASLDGTTFFSKGDSVTVAVTPTDGTDDGASVTSAAVAIINSAPGAPSVEILPERAVANDHDLECVIRNNAEDDDGDSLSYTYSWTVDGVDAQTSTSVIDKTLLAPGEEWTCHVVANDGSVDGAVGSAARVVASWPDNWVTTYYEDFSDGLAQDFDQADSGCGGQSGETSDSTSVWQFTSDWNSARMMIPDTSAPGLAFETRFRFFDDSTATAIRWRSNVVSWDSNDEAGYTLSAQLSASERVFGEDEACVDYCSSGVPLSLEPGDWVVFRVEEWSGGYEVYVDDQLVLEGDTTDIPDLGDYLEINGGGLCGSPVLEVDYIAIQTAATLSGNTPPSSPNISVVPLRPSANTDELTCVIDSPSLDVDGDVAVHL